LGEILLWIKEFPYYKWPLTILIFEHGEAGKLKMEFWITPFDHAAVEGIDRSTVTQLKENDVIGLHGVLSTMIKSKNLKVS